MDAYEAVGRLAAAVARIDYARLDEHVRAHAAHVLLDTIGAMLAASDQPEVSRLAERQIEGDGAATIFRRGAPRSAVHGAVLANGTAATWLELDEGHRPTGHPAVYVLPAVLAVAERSGARGPAVVEALVAGYEVASRLARAAALRPEVHVHGAIAAVGTAVGVARLEQAGPAQIAEAIRVGACMGLSAPFHAATEGALARNGFAAASGLAGLAAFELAASGHLGPRDALETVFGHILGTQLDASALVARAGEPLEITTNYFKRHSACRYTHPTLDALEQAFGDRRIDPADVVAVRVECDRRAALCDDPAPVNGLAARFSVPFAVATRIVGGSSDIDAFSKSAVASSRIRALAESVTVTALPDEPVSGVPRYPARVTVELASGDRLVGSVDRAVGDMPHPLTKSFVREKFAALAARAIAPADVADVSAALLGVGDAPSISVGLAPLRQALGAGA